MADKASSKSVIDGYIGQFMGEFERATEGFEVPNALAMIKVADFEITLARGDYAGIPRQSGNVYRAISKGICVLLPKLLGRMTDGQPAAQPNSIPFYQRVRSGVGLMGDLLAVQRSIDNEQYGLTQCHVLAPQVIEIRRLAEDEEALEHADRNALLDAEHNDRDEIKRRIDTMLANERQAHADRSYPCSPHELAAFTEIGRRYLEFYLPEYPEAEAFADDSIIGPLTFAQWRGIAIKVCALAFAKAELEDGTLQLNGQYDPAGFLLMTPTRISDAELRACFDVAGMPNSAAIFDELAACLILSKDNATAEYGPDVALPCLIRIGEDVFITRYGRLGNPYLFLVARLAKVYAFQMRRLSKERETPFQTDLQRRLDGGDYLFGTPSVTLYHTGKVPLTDIDAVVYEKATNCLYLVQLKWLAVYSSDFKLREKQYNELQTKGAAWLDKVKEWVSKRTFTNVLQHVGVDDASINVSTLQIRYLLLNRGWTRFSAKEAFDTRGAWISWSRLCWLMRCASDSASRLDEAWREASESRAQPLRPTGERRETALPGLTVVFYD
jgi:hypothetical protein